MSAEASTSDATKAPPPTGLGLALVAIVGAEFMLQIDGTIVNVAVPTIESDLGMTVTTASWILNGFFLAFGFVRHRESYDAEGILTKTNIAMAL
ncbi:hypothetical protein ACFQ1S_33910 [Kibdelosporangium lantanae]|uniref:MFS transporter n=1 Tax=Kibdelosporangium lantanae TaxID=1497396 RepID=A0ABW3MJB4_9PSEU